MVKPIFWVKGEGVVRVEELLVVGIERVSVILNLDEDAVGLLNEILVDDLVVQSRRQW